ncbi:DNA repair protein REV1-like isoform X2 [Zingiber officinale]|uniref:DNA repair protein REV1-like isoform X2 n=1 Tax=Zingiber officinale TaxID=94328 RepID=UPI001C4C3FAB|nr:DNA repair protein REV1-like isoform X2 [Zingiber officinale]
MGSNSSDRPSSSVSSFASAAASGGSLKRSRNRTPQNPLRSTTKRKSPFADFGSYMAEKNRKLGAQFRADAASVSSLGSDGAPVDSEEDKGVFRGVSIFVDGFTIPSSQELRGYMLRHGGRFENYFSRDTVTHIICSNLPNSKMRNLRAFSHGLPVVRPEWVLHSLAANRLLSWAPYQLVHGACKQQKLSTYFRHQSISTSSDAKGSINHDEEIKVGQNHSVVPTDGQTSECGGISIQVGDVACLKSEEFSQARDANQEPSASDMVHSTLTDPNFVENYFKNSRLHFIGTWRNRYRQRFSKLLTGVKSSNENLKCHSTKQKTAIIHIDMDCFFVSVIIRNFPDLVHKPVAVCHSDNPRGTAEISSANYVARNFGVKAGIFVRDAKVCCPNLVILPYDFEAYQEVAEQFYNILHKHCSKVQALSCDEAFLDVTECDVDPEDIALAIRKEIAETTRCTASAGIAENLLLARLATRSAKPNEDYLNDLPVMELPGIGYATHEKLKKRQIQTCGQMRMTQKEGLQKDFGEKIGDMLWNYCRGIDNRNVGEVQEAKSIGAEVNWGIRFNDMTDCNHFLINLCKEVSLRLQGCGVQGRTVTLKVKKRKQGAAEPLKFMGCGDCQNMSRSITVPIAIDNEAALLRIAKKFLSSFHIDVKEVRGIGLHLTKLESAKITRKGRENIAVWLSSPMHATRSKCKQISQSDKQCDNGDFLFSSGPPESGDLDSSHKLDQDKPTLLFQDAGSNCSSIKGADCVRPIRSSVLPPLQDLDIDVVRNLPTEIILEMDVLYKGELSDLISKSKGNNCLTHVCSSTVSLIDASTNSADAGISDAHIDSVKLGLDSKDKGKMPICENVESISYVDQVTMEPKLFDLMPASLSQADASVFEQMPEDVKADVHGLLPLHRELKVSKDFYTCFDFPSCVQFPDPHLKTHLWSGDPPWWVEKFNTSKNILLNVISRHAKSSKDIRLSSILQSVAPFLLPVCELSNEVYAEAICWLHELLAQYIVLKIGSDIEEIYNCFCFLKRISPSSKILLLVYNSALPLFQALVNENYGGKLRLSVIQTTDE